MSTPTVVRDVSPVIVRKLSETAPDKDSKSLSLKAPIASESKLKTKEASQYNSVTETLNIHAENKEDSIHSQTLLDLTGKENISVLKVRQRAASRPKTDMLPLRPEKHLSVQMKCDTHEDTQRSPRSQQPKDKQTPQTNPKQSVQSKNSQTTMSVPKPKISITHNGQQLFQNEPWSKSPPKKGLELVSEEQKEQPGPQEYNQQSDTIAFKQVQRLQSKSKVRAVSSFIEAVNSGHLQEH